MAPLPDLNERALRGARLDGYFVVDAHGHLGADGRLDIPLREPGELLAIMDRIGIDVLCVSHLRALDEDVRTGNALLGEALRAHPRRFLGYIVVNPNRPGSVAADLEHGFSLPGMRGIKTHTGMHAYPADGPAYWRAYEAAAARGKTPVLCHAMGTASVAERILKSFPRVPFILAHRAGAYDGRSPDDLLDLANRYDNLYLDLCSTSVYFGALDELIARVPLDRILYASDMCYMHAAHQIGRVLFADIPEPAKRAILGLNAARLFGLPTEKRA